MTMDAVELHRQLTVLQDIEAISGKWKFRHLRAFGRMAAPYQEASTPG